MNATAARPCGDKTPLPTSLSLPLPFPSLRALSLLLLFSSARAHNRRHGRHPMPLYEASPSEPELSKGSAVPPSSLPSKESGRVIRNRHRRPLLPRRCLSSNASDSPPLALLRPNRLHRSTQGEPLPRLPPLLVLPVPPVSAPGRRAWRACRHGLLGQGQRGLLMWWPGPTGH
jgi:hypothetical protein